MLSKPGEGSERDSQISKNQPHVRFTLVPRLTAVVTLAPFCLRAEALQLSQGKYSKEAPIVAAPAAAQLLGLEHGLGKMREAQQTPQDFKQSSPGQQRGSLSSGYISFRKKKNH